MPRHLAEPEKELRFTRSGQATLFWALALVLLCTAAGLLLLGTLVDHRMAQPLPSFPVF